MIVWGKINIQVIIINLVNQKNLLLHSNNNIQNALILTLKPDSVKILKKSEIYSLLYYSLHSNVYLFRGVLN